MLDNIFLHVLNMTVRGSVMLLTLLRARPVVRRAPRSGSVAV